jgi:hypothetical protein
MLETYMYNNCIRIDIIVCTDQRVNLQIVNEIVFLMTIYVK